MLNPDEFRIRFGDRTSKNLAEICVLGLSSASFYKLSCRINIASSYMQLYAAQAMKKEEKKAEHRQVRFERRSMSAAHDFLARRRAMKYNRVSRFFMSSGNYKFLRNCQERILNKQYRICLEICLLNKSQSRI